MLRAREGAIDVHFSELRCRLAMDAPNGTRLQLRGQRNRLRSCPHLPRIHACASIETSSRCEPSLHQRNMSTSLGTCNRPIGTAGATVSCSLDSLTKGQTQVISLNVLAGPVLGNVSDTGSATFNSTDTNPANNSFTVTVKVQ